MRTLRVRHVRFLARHVNLIGLFASALVAASFLPVAALPAAAQDASQSSVNDLANVQLPTIDGQSDQTAFVSATGHTVNGLMLDYWRANGAADGYGNPISEPFASSDGLYSQAFQDAIFQYHPEYFDTEDPVVRLAPVGQTALTNHLDTFQSNGRRGAGGGDRRASAWTPLAPNSNTVTGVTSDGGTFDKDTGHTISGAILKWYNDHEGGFYLGSPLSQPLQARGMTVQYFQGALVLSAPSETYLAPLVQENAKALGIDTAPVAKGNTPEYSEKLFQGLGQQPSDDDLANAGQDGGYLDIVGDLNTPGRKWVEVSLSKEQLWAYQGDTVVMTTPVSTGLDPNVTEPGVFHVRMKFQLQTMTGYTDDSGVNWGTTEPPGGGNPWTVPNVPNVMYFSDSGEALHGTYWHNNFGNPMSHGCVNLPLDVAAWMYDWAPLGTEVWIHD